MCEKVRKETQCFTIALLRLAEEYGLENLRIPVEEVRNAAEYPDILNLVVDFDVSVVGPVLDGVAARMGEVLGVFVWLEQERLSFPRPASDYVWIEEAPDRTEDTSDRAEDPDGSTEKDPA